MATIGLALFACACATQGNDSGGGAADAASSSPAPDRASDAGAASDATTTPDAGMADDAAMGDPSEPPPDAAGSGMCNAVLLFTPIGLPMCDQCLTDNCCALTQACLQDTDCNALSECAINCAASADAGACNADCSLQHQASVLKANMWIKCMQAMCVGTCT